MEHVVTFSTSPGFADEILHVYFTDTLVSGKRNLDEDEFLDNHEVTLAEALKLIQSGDIYDAKTVYAVQYMQIKASRK
jgi:ADP-ribose pyrophosphatase